MSAYCPLSGWQSAVGHTRPDGVCVGSQCAWWDRNRCGVLPRWSEPLTQEISIYGDGPDAANVDRVLAAFDKWRRLPWWKRLWELLKG